MNADWGHAVGLGHFLKDTTALRAFQLVVWILLFKDLRRVTKSSPFIYGSAGLYV